MKVAGCLNRVPARRGWIGYVFRGAAGVRAGWRVALYMALFALFIAGVILAEHRLARPLHLAPPQMSKGGLLITPYFTAINEFSIGLPFLLASLIMAWLEGCSPLAFGLRGRLARRRFGVGLIAGLLSLGAVVGILVAGDWGVLGAQSFAARSALEWALVFLAVGLIEEYGFRGYLLTALGRGIGFWPAAVATSLLFGAAHGINAGETPVGLCNAMAIAFMFCISRQLTGALWWAIGFHAAWDYTESYLAGAHDSGTVSAGALASLSPQGNVWLSGGATGPEGSLLCLAVVVALGAVMWRGWRPLTG